MDQNQNISANLSNDFLIAKKSKAFNIRALRVLFYITKYGYYEEIDKTIYWVANIDAVKFRNMFQLGKQNNQNIWNTTSNRKNAKSNSYQNQLNYSLKNFIETKIWINIKDLWSDKKTTEVLPLYSKVQFKSKGKIILNPILFNSSKNENTFDLEISKDSSSYTKIWLNLLYQNSGISKNAINLIILLLTKPAYLNIKITELKGYLGWIDLSNPEAPVEKYKTPELFRFHFSKILDEINNLDENLSHIKLSQNINYDPEIKISKWIDWKNFSNNHEFLHSNLIIKYKNLNFINHNSNSNDLYDNQELISDNYVKPEIEVIKDLETQHDDDGEIIDWNSIEF